jgi:hypothetical protein
MKGIFACNDANIDSMNLDSGEITINGTTKTKAELCRDVCFQLTAQTPLMPELGKAVELLRTATR